MRLRRAKTKEVGELINQLGAGKCWCARVHDDDVVAGWQDGKFGGNDGTQATTNAIADHGAFRHLCADHEGKPRLRARPSDAQLKWWNTTTFSTAQDTDNVPVSREAMRPGEHGLDADALTPFATTRLEHALAARRLHALTEAMDALTSALLWLVGSFGHSFAASVYQPWPGWSMLWMASGVVHLSSTGYEHSTRKNAFSEYARCGSIDQCRLR